MARRNDRGAVLARLNEGIVPDDASDSGTPAKTGDDKGAQNEARPSVEKSGTGTGRGTGGAGTKPAPTTAAAPSAVFGKRSAETLGTVSSRPEYGTHPKTGERVEIDWTADGAGPESPFGTLDNGKPRQRKKSARKTRTKTAGTATAAKTTENLTVLTQILQIGHVGLASVLGPHWKLSDDEAEAYADALTDLQAAYDFDVDPKQAAWIKLAMVAGVPTGMRIYATIASGARSSEPKQAEQAKPASPKKTASAVKTASQEASTPSELFKRMGASDFAG